VRLNTHNSIFLSAQKGKEKKNQKTGEGMLREGLKPKKLGCI
jgi:hypothetical protein